MVTHRPKLTSDSFDRHSHGSEPGLAAETHGAEAMQYLITNLWKLPTINGAKIKGTEITGTSDAQADDSSTKDTHSLMAAACRDCNQYNFPPKAQCRYCGSPRVHTVQVPGNSRANPGTFIFGAAEESRSRKPN
jgi:hypothetical protein